MELLFAAILAKWIATCILGGAIISTAAYLYQEMES